MLHFTQKGESSQDWNKYREKCFLQNWDKTRFQGFA